MRNALDIIPYIDFLISFNIYVESEDLAPSSQAKEAQITKQFYMERLYPNPTKDILKIGFSSPDERKITIKLYDVCIRIVHQENII
ncbi:MAG: hypothetical protein ACUVQT_04205 [bacterium]